MNKKNLIILGVTVVVFIILFLPERGNESKETTFAKITNEIDQIEITKNGVKNTLYLDGDKWRVKGGKDYEADFELVEPILTFIRNDIRGELVSDFQVYEKYGLNEEQRIKYVFFEGGNELGEMAIGSRGNKRDSFYFLWGDGGKIYQVQEDRSPFDKSREDFIDKKIFSRKASLVNALTIFKGNEKLTLKKLATEEEGNPVFEWKDEEGEAYDLNKVNDVVNTIVNLAAEEFLDDREKGDFTGFAYQYVLNSTENWDLKLSLYDEVEDRFVAGAEALPHIFVLNQEDSGRLAIKSFMELK